MCGAHWVLACCIHSSFSTISSPPPVVFETVTRTHSNAKNWIVYMVHACTQLSRYTVCSCASCRSESSPGALSTLLLAVLSGTLCRPSRRKGGCPTSSHPEQIHKSLKGGKRSAAKRSTKPHYYSVSLPCKIRLLFKVEVVKQTHHAVQTDNWQFYLCCAYLAGKSEGLQQSR